MWLCDCFTTHHHIWTIDGSRQLIFSVCYSVFCQRGQDIPVLMLPFDWALGHVTVKADIFAVVMFLPILWIGKCYPQTCQNIDISERYSITKQMSRYSEKFNEEIETKIVMFMILNLESNITCLAHISSEWCEKLYPWQVFIRMIQCLLWNLNFNRIRMDFSQINYRNYNSVMPLNLQKGVSPGFSQYTCSLGKWSHYIRYCLMFYTRQGCGYYFYPNFN